MRFPVWQRHSKARREVICQERRTFKQQARQIISTNWTHNCHTNTQRIAVRKTQREDSWDVQETISGPFLCQYTARSCEIFRIWYDSLNHDNCGGFLHVYTKRDAEFGCTVYFPIQIFLEV
jgi:hypothetical protein